MCIYIMCLPPPLRQPRTRLPRALATRRGLDRSQACHGRRWPKHISIYIYIHTQKCIRTYLLLDIHSIYTYICIYNICILEVASPKKIEMMVKSSIYWVNMILYTVIYVEYISYNINYD